MRINTYIETYKTKMKKKNKKLRLTSKKGSKVTVQS